MPVLLLIVSWTVADEQIQPKQVTLDPHVHVMYDKRLSRDVAADLRDFFSRNLAQYVFLISPTYLISERREYPEFHLSQRQRIDEKISELVDEFKGRAFGLCGFNLDWPDAVGITDECLSRDGMVGIKLHLDIWEDRHRDHLTQPEYFKKVRDVLEANDGLIKVFFVHMPSKATATFQVVGQPDVSQEKEANFKKDANEVRKLVELARMFPRTQFILAHALGDYRLVAILANENHNPRLKNIWLETSDFFTNSTRISHGPEIGDPHPSWKFAIRIWRHFGIDRILFGSDTLLGQLGIDEHAIYKKGQTFELQHRTLQNNPYLNDDEKKRIFHDNPKELLRHLKIVVPQEPN